MTSNMKALFGNVRLKKIAVDFTYNIFSSLIYTGVVQIAVYPILATTMSAEKYGLLLTIMGIVNVITMSLGSTLNNTRLIQNVKYMEKDTKGDFNLLLLAANATGIIVILFITNTYFQFDLVTKILIAGIIVPGITNAYLNVAYRIKLNFKMSFFASIVASVGFVAGLLLVKYTKLWPCAFVVSGLFNLVFLLLTSNLHKEPYKKTELFRTTSVKYSFLMISGVLSSLVIYLDRLIVYPSLGGEAVSIYTVAAFFGKSLGLVMTPIAGILLSYYSQKSFAMTRKRFWRINIVVLIASAMFFAISLLLSPWVTGLLYPTIITLARPYIVLANCASIIGVAASMTDPVILKFAPTYWQIILYSTYMCSYIGLSVILISRYSLFGLCLASICAHSIKLLFLYLLGNHYVKKVVT